MIIADEWHHASAFTYEQILKTTHAKYIYGPYVSGELCLTYSRWKREQLLPY
jgi:hypothetical protein